MLSNWISPDSIFEKSRISLMICKRLHPDLNPNQTEDEKDLFIKVKASKDLQKLSELKKILLILDELCTENLTLTSGDEKLKRVKHLERNISDLKEKIAQLKQSFPFSIEELIFNEEAVRQKQEEIQNQIKNIEKEIDKYSNIISIMIDE